MTLNFRKTKGAGAPSLTAFQAPSLPPLSWRAPSKRIISGLVATRDLGQDVEIALTKANPRNGWVAGLACAFIGMIADRPLSAAARSALVKLGLEGAS